MWLNPCLKTKTLTRYDKNKQSFNECIKTDSFALIIRNQMEGANLKDRLITPETYRRCLFISCNDIISWSIHRCLQGADYKCLEIKVHLAFNSFFRKLLFGQYPTNSLDYQRVDNVRFIQWCFEYWQWSNCHKMLKMAIIYWPPRGSSQMD